MRRLAAIAAALLALSVGAAALAPVAAAASDAELADVTLTRYGGADRYATSLLAAEAVAADAGGSLETVVMVSGVSWHEAVVAASVAGRLDAPVLMTPPTELRADALEFLRRVEASDALLVSAGADAETRSISSTVASALESAGLDVEWVGGADQYETGVAVARRAGTVGTLGDFGSTAIVASGEVFADALVAGPLSARGRHPVLLSPKTHLDSGVESYLSDAGIRHIVLMGGTGALSSPVEDSIRDLGITVSRIAGATRYDTAIKMASLIAEHSGGSCFGGSAVGLARARVPFDSFSAAPLLARQCAPLVLADPGAIPSETAAFLDAARQANKVDELQLTIFGGDGAVSQEAIDTYLTGGTTEETEAIDEEAFQPTVLPAGTCGGSGSGEDVRFAGPSPSLFAPAWSPDCEYIAFAERGALQISRPDGSHKRQVLKLSGAGVDADAPAWSPDGTKIAYVRRDSVASPRTSRIFVVNADGTGNRQLSRGEGTDDSPSWSPDGSRIVFSREVLVSSPEDLVVHGSRSIVTMEAETGGDVQVAAGRQGRWFDAPRWSPDGRRFAFVEFGRLGVMDTDGSNVRFLRGGVRRDSLSWSPDGSRIAYASGDHRESDIYIVEVDEARSLQVTNAAGPESQPAWSPDGERIAYRKNRLEGNRLLDFEIWIADASGTSDGDTAESEHRACMPLGLIDEVTAGFPLPTWAPPAIGSLQVAVVFADFPDAQATYSTQEEADVGLPLMTRFLEEVSYGRLDVTTTVRHGWLRMTGDYSDYFSERTTNEQVAPPDAEARSLPLEIVAAADPSFDFAGSDIVLFVLPSSHFGGGQAGGDIIADGSLMQITFANTMTLPQQTSARNWGLIAAHEVAHALGLTDLYPYGDDHRRTPRTDSQIWVRTVFGRMRLESYFPASPGDSRLEEVRRHVDGHTQTATAWHVSFDEMLAWSRWQLGWLGDDQVRCVTESVTTVELEPVAAPRVGTVMTVVPLAPNQVLVMESRRRLGFDNARPYSDSVGTRVTPPGLPAEGVLVYTVDASLGAGDLPLKIAGDSGDGTVEDFPLLEAGDSVTVRGYTVSVTADSGQTHTVTITKTN
ncbi:cell wall-binding repeat-containing protein [Candidatus Poriferisodalis sp.]|uniref:cell wall-binding repeat-containing protein n=1 Tax=Candidatus Poriferisodalis sp. TaxID=3101277 RepID=UPI003C6F6519